MKSVFEDGFLLAFREYRTARSPANKPLQLTGSANYARGSRS